VTSGGRPPRIAADAVRTAVDAAGAVDDLGLVVAVPPRVERVVSIVPSLTEAVAASDCRLLVGATDWCTHPRDLDVRRIGGTKNPDVAAIVALRPDVVVANEEENREPDLYALRDAGLAVWVTRVRTLPEAFTALRRLLTLACRLEAPGWLDDAERAWARVPTGLDRGSAVIPIWRRPWMVVGRDTFTGDVLARLGIRNLYAEAADRYPKVPLEQLVAARPDLVVLPDEPYPFAADDGPEAFPGIPSALVSGRLLTWYGPSLAEAPDALIRSLDAARGAAR
jgi:ABC-type Fe3+-hydroxamate transport system substrate-binding protein